MDDKALARFHAKTVADDTGGCLIWVGAHNSRGYGSFAPNGTHVETAHRVAYEHWIGPIPEGLFLDHLCRVRSCVNPFHLEPVTSHENWLRGQQRSRVVQLTGQCIRGHDLTPDNLNRSGFDAAGRPRLRCAECDRTNHRRAYRARTANRR